MAVLSKYFLRFFLYCVVLTMIFGFITTLVPNSVARLFTAFPFLIAMVLVLYHLIKKEQRAPTRLERNKISLGLILIFFFYNICFALLGPLLFNWQVENIISIWLSSIGQKEFLFQLIAQLMMYMIPLYVITWWFYGKQAQRMAAKMYPN